MKNMSAKDLIHNLYLEIVSENIVFSSKDDKPRIVAGVVSAIVNHVIRPSDKSLAMMAENPQEGVAYAKRLVDRWLSIDPRNKVVPVTNDAPLKALLMMARTAPMVSSYRAEIREHIERRIEELKRQKSSGV